MHTWQFNLQPTVGLGDQKQTP
uniref:Uncharacterized protein n=1 Tax=Anguilla anguilla TaxID=7936 RepID=A0A0E9SKE0_ANGAN